ncbi:MAG TPA: hypothetical protein EYG67_04700 [Campylobacterales bacterium]|nr:hypothetical protein [Campylobacterales bacterium]HIP41689.1 hypothetical protein [Campylobacterales bacterium]
MLKNIIILVVLAVAIFALTLFYKQSSFELTSQSLIVKTKQHGVVFPYNEIKKDKHSFSNVKLIQHTLKSGDEKLIYEVATVDGLYEFNDNPKEVVVKLFDAKNSISLFTNNGLEALQLTLANNSKVNLLLIQTDTKELHLLYGLSDKLFAQSVEQLSGMTNTPSIGAVALLEPLTKWSVKVNEIDGIISSIDH